MGAADEMTGTPGKIRIGRYKAPSQEIRAEIFGPFAAHAHGHNTCVTHVPTGLLISEWMERDSALRQIHWLTNRRGNIDWGSVRESDADIANAVRESEDAVCAGYGQ